MDERRGDRALGRRIRRRDPEILRAALRWIVDGARTYYAAGMDAGEPPERIVRATREWRKQADVVLAYWDAGRITADPGSLVLSTDLYAEYAAWCQTQGNRPHSAKSFNPAFADHQETKKHHVTRQHTRTKATARARLSRPREAAGAVPT